MTEQRFFAQVFQDELRAVAALSAQTAVWLALKSHTNAAGECFPSNKRLADLTGLSMPSVKKATARLVRDGFLLVSRESPKGRATYTPTVPYAGHRVPSAGLSGTSTEVPSTGPNNPSTGHRVPSAGHRVPSADTVREVEVDNEEKERTGPAIPDNVRLVFETWIKATKRTGRTHLDAKRRRLIQAALKSHGLEITLDAVVGVTKVDWNAGKNDSGKTYDDLELVLRGSKNIERFSKAAHAVAVPDASAITAQMEALVEERFAHREHFVETFHTQHKMQDATAVLPEWEADLRAAWGVHFPRRHIMHLGQMVLVPNADVLHFHCVMLAALAYTRQMTDEKYRGDDDASVGVRREAANAERNQRRALKEQIERIGSAS